MFQPGLLQGKRILVTGGGSGLGAAMAARFAELGASLALCGRRAEPLEATAAALRERGASVATARCDVRDADAVEAMVERLWAEAPVDVLVNNAAATFIAETEKLSARAADGILATTLSQDACMKNCELFGREVIPRFDRDPVHSTTRYREAALAKTTRAAAR